MDTLSAFIMGDMNRWKERKVFDWNKAARLIRENDIVNAYAGLAEDWNDTSGQILEHGLVIRSDYTYLASTWATPVIYDSDKQKEYPCYVMEHETRWNESTKWPASAVKILKEGDEVNE